MKQTAVNYLFEKLWDRPKDKSVWKHYLEKAKKMEKEQIENAFDEGVCEGFDYATIKDTIDSDTGKQYYYETYGKNA